MTHDVFECKIVPPCRSKTACVSWPLEYCMLTGMFTALEYRQVIEMDQWMMSVFFVCALLMSKG